MSRTGLSSLMGYAPGGAVDLADVPDATETTSTGLGGFDLNPNDVIQNFQSYRNLLEMISPPPRRLTGYDLASEIGKGLLLQQKEKLPSLGRGVGLGFQEFKKLQDEIEEEARKSKQTRDITAFGLAAKSKSPSALKPLSLYKDTNNNVFQGFVVGNELIFKGYDKATGETLSLKENDFFQRYPSMRPTTDSELAKGFMEVNAFNKLQLDIKNERDSGGKLQDYLTNQKDREVGFKLLADDFVGLMKTAMGENNLTEDELKKRILDADFQSLLGGFRIETVGPGVMTEYDAQRIVSSLGGEPGALQNPTLVASVLRDIFERKVERINLLQGQYNEQIKMGNYPLREEYNDYVFNEELFKFEPKFPDESTNRKTNDDGSIEYDLGGKRFKILTNGMKVELGEGDYDSDVSELTVGGSG
jgi:Sec-independent protein translocase protein TatA